MYFINVENYKFSNSQREKIFTLLKNRIRSEPQANCFIEELEKGITYFQSQRKKNSLHNSIPEAYRDNDIKKLKSDIDRTIKTLELINPNSGAVINQYYYLREKENIASGDWQLHLQCIAWGYFHCL